MTGWTRDVLRLTGLLVCVGLATTRLGLLAHELAGHGGATWLVGGTVTDVRLFTFGGGWIRSAVPTQGHGWLPIALAGVAVELAVGLALWLTGPRVVGLAGRVVRAAGAALIIHGAWYLATGTWHGYGDGARLHREMGDARAALAIPVGLVAIGAAFAGARTVLGPLAATIAGGRARRIGGLVLAVIVAAAVQGGLLLGEVALRRDRTYASVMQTEADRVIARELARWADDARRRGTPPGADAERGMARDLAERHRPFPFAYVLGALLLAAIAAGARCSRLEAASAITRTMLVRAMAAAAGSIALVVALDRVFL